MFAYGKAELKTPNETNLLNCSVVSAVEYINGINNWNERQNNRRQSTKRAKKLRKNELKTKTVLQSLWPSSTKHGLKQRLLFPKAFPKLACKVQVLKRVRFNATNKIARIRVSYVCVPKVYFSLERQILMYVENDCHQITGAVKIEKWNLMIVWSNQWFRLNAHCFLSFSPINPIGRYLLLLDYSQTG